MTLKIGDTAPDFTLPADDNTQIKLSNLRGKKVILYFYPKDNTPGCTKQACDFRDNLDQFQSDNTIVLGISKDNTAKHEKFKEKYQLPFTLLSDEDAKICKTYGVINKKTLFGKIFMGIERTTFLINEKGIILAIWRKVKVTNHVAKVLQTLNTLQTEQTS